jgi:hypothetical protein
LQVYPVEQRFFRLHDFVRPAPRALFLKAPKQILGDVPLDDANRRAAELSCKTCRHARLPSSLCASLR